MIQIQPVQVFPNTATQISFGLVSVVIGQSASVPYALCDSTGKALINGVAELNPAQYAGWGTDDTYMENCLLQNLGLTRV